jgi:hypothetical protein
LFDGQAVGLQIHNKLLQLINFFLQIIHNKLGRRFGSWLTAGFRRAAPKIRGVHLKELGS